MDVGCRYIHNPKIASKLLAGADLHNIAIFTRPHLSACLRVQKLDVETVASLVSS